MIGMEKKTIEIKIPEKDLLKKLRKKVGVKKTKYIQNLINYEVETTIDHFRKRVYGGWELSFHSMLFDILNQVTDGLSEDIYLYLWASLCAEGMNVDYTDGKMIVTKGKKSGKKKSKQKRNK